MIIVDTSAIVATIDADSTDHRACADTLLEADDVLGVSPMVVAEADYLLSTRLGDRYAAAFLSDVSNGAYQLLPVDTADLAEGAEVCNHYGDLPLGITDAMNIVLADRHHTTLICTLDQRHFRAVKPLSGGAAFTLLPMDR